jgi:hypothetical protein
MKYSEQSYCTYFISFGTLSECVCVRERERLETVVDTRCQCTVERGNIYGFWGISVCNCRTHTHTHVLVQSIKSMMEATTTATGPPITTAHVKEGLTAVAAAADLRRTRETLDKIQVDQKEFISAAVDQEQALNEEESSLRAQIHAAQRSITALTKQRAIHEKKHARLKDVTHRLSEDLSMLAQKVSQWQADVRAHEDSTKRELATATSALKDLKSMKHSLEESQVVVMNNILITRTVIAQLQSEHAIALTNLQSISKTAFDAFHCWSAYYPAVYLSHQTYENHPRNRHCNAVRTMHTMAQTVGAMEEFQRLKQLCAEIQAFSNLDFNSLLAAAASSRMYIDDEHYFNNNYIWEGLLSKFRRHTDREVNEAMNLINDIEDLECTR